MRNDTEQVPFEAVVAEEPAAAEHTPEEEKEVVEEAPKTLSVLVSACEEGRPNISLRSILGGDIITGNWFKKHFAFIIMLSVMAIIYISNRYAYEFDMIEQKELTDTLHDRRYKALTRSSQLLEKKLRSNVEEDLADSTIQTASTPSYVIKINKGQ